MLTTLKNKIRHKLNNEYTRESFVQGQLAVIPQGSTILDAGCGSQQYRRFCAHLDYKAQDFGQFGTDATEGFTAGMGGAEGYNYGKLDYVGNIWDIDERDAAFDAILCTEVFEHIPYPNETVAEFARLTKPGGRLILTVPSNCLRHMEPYFFYSGFSDHYLQQVLDQHGYDIESLDPIGDYYSWIAVELARTMKHHSPLSWVVNAPALLWFMARRRTPASINTLCMGYHVVARRRAQ